MLGRLPLLIACLLLPVLAWSQPVGIPLPVADTGIFPDLNAKVRLHRPPWLPNLQVRVDPKGQAWWTAQGVPLLPAQGENGQARLTPAMDRDGDGIGDQADLLAGAHKVALDNAPYGSPYRQLSYPGGDVPREEGVCTDVVIRALRNAGYDLQQLVHEDILAAPKAYPMVHGANASIDHRRVKTLLPYFERHWQSRPNEVRNSKSDWWPGDVVLMDTLPKPGPDHIGIVSDRLGPSGLPLIINSWTDGYRTTEMDLLPNIPVTHRFRLPSAQEDGTVRAALSLVGTEVPAKTAQVILVTVPTIDADQGWLSRWQRTPQGWQPVEAAIAVHVGRSGLAWGLGLHRNPKNVQMKREGDGRSPLGLFRLETAFGTGVRPAGVQWPWRQADAQARWVDDPKSRLYNTWQQSGENPSLYKSAEVLARSDGLYDLALVIAHNAQSQPGAGSAIFMHIDSGQGTAGCTTLPRQELLRLLQWLDPSKAPLLLQVVMP